MKETQTDRKELYALQAESAYIALDKSDKKEGVTDILNQEMSGRKFLLVSLLGSLFLLLLTMGLHVYLDIYGLFRSVAGRELPVYHNERVSKYLLAHRYIPQNFNTVVIGPSLSANLDISSTNRNSGPLEVYNASIMGANITELKPVLGKALEGGVKNVIICLSPYMLKDSGFKEVSFDDKLYWGALGSKNLYETYLIAGVRHFNLMPNKFPKGQINEYGVNNYYPLFQVEDVQKQVELVMERNKDNALTIDSTAYQELKALIQQLKAQNVNYLGYFHPEPSMIYNSQREEYEKFEILIQELIQDERRIIDFNDPQFQSFTDDFTNYIDHAHLSYKGQKVITDSLMNRLMSMKEQRSGTLSRN